MSDEGGKSARLGAVSGTAFSRALSQNRSFPSGSSGSAVSQINRSSTDQLSSLKGGRSSAHPTPPVSGSRGGGERYGGGGSTAAPPRRAEPAIAGRRAVESVAALGFLHRGPSPAAVRPLAVTLPPKFPAPGVAAAVFDASEVSDEVAGEILNCFQTPIMPSDIARKAISRTPAGRGADDDEDEDFSYLAAAAPNPSKKRPRYVVPAGGGHWG